MLDNFRRQFPKLFAGNVEQFDSQRDLEPDFLVSLPCAFFGELNWEIGFIGYSAVSGVRETRARAVRENEGIRNTIIFICRFTSVSKDRANSTGYGASGNLPLVPQVHQSCVRTDLSTVRQRASSVRVTSPSLRARPQVGNTRKSGAVG